MRAADGGTGLAGIGVDRLGTVPVYRQLYASVREAVLAGRLPPGARLPSARSLAAQLAVARGTVEARVPSASPARGSSWAGVPRGPSSTRG